MKDISISIDNGVVNASFIIVAQKTAQHKEQVCFIPGFNLHYSTADSTKVTKIGRAMVYGFVNHWIKQEGWQNFIIRIHQLGFRVEGHHNLAMGKLLKKRPIKTRLEADISQYSIIGEDYEQVSTEIMA